MTTNNYAVSTNGGVVSRATQILEAKIEAGRASAANVFERVNYAIPVDAIVRGNHFEFYPGDNAAGFGAKWGGSAGTIHRHALSQFAEKADVPGAYVAELVNGAPWQRGLAARILNDSFYNGGAGRARHLVRSPSRRSEVAACNPTSTGASTRGRCSRRSPRRARRSARCRSTATRPTRASP